MRLDTASLIWGHKSNPEEENITMILTSGKFTRTGHASHDSLLWAKGQQERGAAQAHSQKPPIPLCSSRTTRHSTRLRVAAVLVFAYLDTWEVIRVP